MAVIGIDLGTSNSLACIYRDGRAELIPNELGEYKTSSAVSVLQDGTVLVGAAAISIQQGEEQYSLLLTAPLLRRLCEPVFQRVRSVISRAMKDREWAYGWIREQLDALEAELAADP